MIQYTTLNACIQDEAKEVSGNYWKSQGEVREFQNQKLVDTLLIILLFKLNLRTKIAENNLRERRTKVSLHASRIYLTRFQLVRQICSRHVKSHFCPSLRNILFRYRPSTWTSNLRKAMEGDTRTQTHPMYHNVGPSPRTCGYRSLRPVVEYYGWTVECI